MSCKCQTKSDIDVIEDIIKNAENGIAVIPQRKLDLEPERDYWLIDRAVLIPENTTVVLKNCKIKLSDKCRDNFFRSANCEGALGHEIKTMKNIHIIGEGYSVLEGADHPRSTGDSGKILKCPCYKKADDILEKADWITQSERESGVLSFAAQHDCSYGTDALVEGECHKGDWRNIGILFACVENFSIENLHIVESHGWGISLENCAYGIVDKIDFDAKMQREIDGILHNIENQDGLDLRNGCHDIRITNISGQTGDDLIALTAIASNDKSTTKNGELNSTHYMHNDWSKRDTDIHNIIIRDIIGRSQGGAICNTCSMIRFLAAGTKIYNVVLDGVINVHDDGLREKRTLLIGDADGYYGKNIKGSLSNFTISNIICDSNLMAIHVKGYLCDSVISNVINKNPFAELIVVDRENGMTNVQTYNIT